MGQKIIAHLLENETKCLVVANEGSGNCSKSAKSLAAITPGKRQPLYIKIPAGWGHLGITWNGTGRWPGKRDPSKTPRSKWKLCPLKMPCIVNYAFVSQLCICKSITKKKTDEF